VSHQAHKYALDSFVRFCGAEERGHLNLAQALAFYANPAGESIRPSLGTIALKLGCTTRAVRLGVRELERIGWLRCVVRSIGRRPTEYEIAPMVDETLAAKARNNPEAGFLVDGLNKETGFRVDDDATPEIWRSDPGSLPRPTRKSAATNAEGDFRQSLGINIKSRKNHTEEHKSDACAARASPRGSLASASPELESEAEAAARRAECERACAEVADAMALSSTRLRTAKRRNRFDSREEQLAEVNRLLRERAESGAAVVPQPTRENEK
jgi:hypothetical protein